MSDRTPQEPGQDDAPLAPDLAWVERLLLAEGRRWRETEPSTDGLARHVRALANTTSASAANQRPAYADKPLLEAQKARRLLAKGLREPMDIPPTPTRARWRASAGALAAVVVVGALATLLIRGAGPRGLGHLLGADGTATPAHVKGTRYAPGIVAPNDLSVVYRVDGNNNPERSTDGGRTYKTLPKPRFDLAPSESAWVAVSPLNASYVLYSVTGSRTSATPQSLECPTPYSGSHSVNIFGTPDPTETILQQATISPTGTAGSQAPGAIGDLPGQASISNYSFCTEQFVSVNAGQTWTRLSLPDHQVLGSAAPIHSPFGAFQGASQVFQAQGTRLYASAGFAVENGQLVFSNYARLLVSDDGGRTWAYADTNLASVTPFVCDFAAAPDSATLYAVVAPKDCVGYGSPLTLYRSDDAGESWAKVSVLPHTTEASMLVSRSGALYLYNPEDTVTQVPVTNPQGTPIPGGASSIASHDSPQYALVSMDGGATFQAAPLAGMPKPDTLSLNGPLAALSDGAVIYANMASDPAQGFYLWKPGAPTWTRLNIQASDEVAAMIVTPGAGGGDTLTITDMSGTITTVHVQE